MINVRIECMLLINKSVGNDGHNNSRDSVFSFLLNYIQYTLRIMMLGIACLRDKLGKTILNSPPITIEIKRNLTDVEL